MLGPEFETGPTVRCGHMARHPVRVTRIARRVLAYLGKTTLLALTLGGREQGSSSSSSSSSSPTLQASMAGLAGKSDASFAPTGERSFGASVITVNQPAVAWRGHRQAFTTLSVMEAELVEAVEATLMFENTAASLGELHGEPVRRELRRDNSAATAILQGGHGSWNVIYAFGQPL